MNPISRTWDIGTNQHGQPVELTESSVNGATQWIIRRGQADQRDDEQAIILSIENMRSICAAFGKREDGLR